MRKDEAKFHTKVKRWLKYNIDKFPTKSFLWETKVCRLGKKSFPFSELTEKEENLLLMAKHKTLIQTHSDYSRLGTNCDGSVVSGGGYIIIQWVRRANKKFYIIDIDDWLMLKDHLTQKSITEDYARMFGIICYLK